MLKVVTYPSIRQSEGGTLNPLDFCVMPETTATRILKHMADYLATRDRQALQRYNAIKQKLPCYTPSSTASARNLTDAVYSGVMVFDMDEAKHTAKTVAEAQNHCRAWLAGCQRLGALFGGLSASGCGAYAGFYVPQATKETYTPIYELLACYLQDELGPELDTTKDLSRARFVGQTLTVWQDDLATATPLNLPEGKRHALLVRYAKRLQCTGSTPESLRTAAASVLGDTKETRDIVEYTGRGLYTDAAQATAAALKAGCLYALREDKPTVLIRCQDGLEVSGGWQKTAIKDAQGNTFLIKGTKKALPLTFSEYITELPLESKTIAKVTAPYLPRGFSQQGHQQFFNARPIYRLEEAIAATRSIITTTDRQNAASLATFLSYQLGTYAGHYARWVVEHIGSALVGKRPHVAGTAWIFIGRGGTGKSTAARLPEVLLGHMRHAKEGEPLGRFTQGLSEALFFDWPEVPDIVSKDIITGQSITIEHKGKDIEQVPNVSAQIYTTNYYKCASLIAQDSGLYRRYHVVDVDNDLIPSLGWATMARCQQGTAEGCTDAPEWLAYYHRPPEAQSLGYIKALWSEIKRLARQPKSARPPLDGLTSALKKDMLARNTVLGVVYKHLLTCTAGASIDALLEVVKMTLPRAVVTAQGLESMLELIPAIFAQSGDYWSIKAAKGPEPSVWPF